MNRLFARETVTIGAPADTLFALVSDPVRMAAFTEEAVGARWMDGATAAAVGARFTGFNRNGQRRWHTVCSVVTLEPGSRFAFDVAVPVVRIPIARWEYAVEPVAEGTCAVTESTWVRAPLWFIPFGMLITGVLNRPAKNAANIAATLGRLKAHVEA